MEILQLCGLEQQGATVLEKICVSVEAASLAAENGQQKCGSGIRGS